MASNLVSTRFVIGKSIRFDIEKNIVIENVLDFVSYKFGIQKKFRIRFHSDFWYFGWHFGFEISRFQNFSIFSMVLDLLSKIFGIKKLSDSVSFRFWVLSHTDTRSSIVFIWSYSLLQIFRSAWVQSLGSIWMRNGDLSLSPLLWKSEITSSYYLLVDYIQNTIKW